MKGILLAATTALLWGILAIALKVALGYFDSYTIVWFRFFIATITLVAYYAITKPSLLSIYKNPPRMMLLAALLLAGNYIGYVQGIDLAGPAATQIIIQTGPVILGIIGFTIFKEKINLIRGFGFAVAIIGFLVFYLNQNSEANTNHSAFNEGVMWILFAACSWSGYAVINKKLIQTYHPQQINLIIFALPILLFAPTVSFSTFTLPHPWWVWLLMVALGLNTVVAYGTLSAAFKYAEANKISIIIIMNPVITFIILELIILLNLNWFTIDVVPTLAYMGAALVLLGTILALGISQKKKR